MRSAFLVLLLVLNVPALAESGKGINNTLPRSVKSVLARYKIPESSLSVFVQSVGDPQPRFLLNPDVSRNPASVMKAVTTLAALELLGPSYYWKTEAFTRGSLIRGELKGDLHIRGGGDPHLLVEDFWRFLRRMREAGLQRISGDLILDNSLFELPEFDPGAFDDRPFRTYNVGPDALLLNFKSTRFRFRPDRTLNKVIVVADPPATSLEIRNDLRLTSQKCRGHLRRLQMDVATHVVGGGTVRFLGDYPASCGALTLRRAVLPTLPYVFGVFEALWGEMGGSIQGTVRRGAVPDDARHLHSMRSDPLSDLIRRINKFSNNVMTRQLLLTLASERVGAPGTMGKGHEAIADWLKAKGLEPNSIALDNGSGLSRNARLTARSLGLLLAQVYSSPLMPQFVSSLPVSAVDGTLRSRYRGDALAGRLHLKTGLIDDVSAIAGYIWNKDEDVQVVVVLINHAGVHRGRGRRVQDAVLRWLHDS